MPLLLSFLIRCFLGIIVGLVDRFRSIDMLLFAGLLFVLFTTIFLLLIMLNTYCWLLPPNSSIIM